MEAASENLQSEGGEESPKAWWSSHDLQDVNLQNIHAANATCAAFHADVAAKHAASLAQWVEYLWGQVHTLSKKVAELEDWKKRALEDMSKLKDDHRKLRRKFSQTDGGDGSPIQLPGKARSMPLLLSSHVEAAEVDANTLRRNKVDAEALLPEMRAPPGLEAADDPQPEKLAQVSFQEQRPPSPPAVFEGVYVTVGDVDGVPCARAEWRIGHLCSKLRNHMGRPLVSSPFTASGLQDLRLMVCPEGKDATKGSRSRRQRDLYTKKVTEGPLEGSLKLKVPNCPPPHVVEYWLKVGSARRGPFRHNFAESTVHGCSDFGVDWLAEADADNSLTLTLEIVEAPPGPGNTAVCVEECAGAEIEHQEGSQG